MREARSAVAARGLARAEAPPVLDGAPLAAAAAPAGLASSLRSVARSPTALVGVLVLGLWIVCGIAWPVIAPYDPNQFHVSARLRPPSADFWFGSDQFGRDVF